MAEPQAGETDGDGAVLGEIGRHQGDGGTEHQAAAQALAEALGQEQLPVARAQRGHEDAEQLQHGAGGQHGLEVAGVGGAAGEGADEEQQEDLDAADPGDVGGRVAQGLHVVGLEHAEAVDVAPGVEDDQVRHGDLQPGVPAAIGRRAGV